MKYLYATAHAEPRAGQSLFSLLLFHDVVDACRADKGYIFVNHLPGKVAVAVHEVLVGEDIFYDSRSFFRCVPVEFRRFVIMPCLNSFPRLPFMPGTFRNSYKSYQYRKLDFGFLMNLLHFSFYQGPRFKADRLKLLKSLKIFQTWSFIRLTGQKNMAFNECILKANRKNCMRKMDATQSFTMKQSRPHIQSFQYFMSFFIMKAIMI